MRTQLPDWDTGVALMVKNTFFDVYSPLASTPARPRRTLSAPPSIGNLIEPCPGTTEEETLSGPPCIRNLTEPCPATIQETPSASSGIGNFAEPCPATSQERHAAVAEATAPRGAGNAVAAEEDSRGHADQGVGSGVGSGSPEADNDQKVVHAHQGLPLQVLPSSSGEEWGEEVEEKDDLGHVRGIVRVLDATATGSPGSSSPSEEQHSSARPRMKRRPCKAKRDRYRRLVERYVTLAKNNPDTWLDLAGAHKQFAELDPQTQQAFIEDVLRHAQTKLTQASHSKSSHAGPAGPATPVWQ